MRVKETILPPLAIAACLLSLTSCGKDTATTQPTVSVGTIVSNAVVAAQSASVLVQQVAASPALAANASVQKQAAKISSVLATGTASADTINTLAAALLGLAGAAGVQLQGAGLK